MPRPMPRAVTRLIAKMLTLVTWVVMKSARNEPSTATAPITAGSPEATSAPNTSSMRSIVIGMAMLSARCRSFSIVDPTSANTTGEPDTCTVRAPSGVVPASSLAISPARFWAASPDSVIRAVMRASEPSVLRIAGFGVAQ